MAKYRKKHPARGAPQTADEPEDIIHYQTSHLSHEASSITILCLPPEMMEEVATHLPGEDLASLRLVCRDVNKKVLSVYARECFSDKTFLLALPRSMKILEEISCHPRFGKALKRIRLSFQCLPSARIDDFDRR